MLSTTLLLVLAGVASSSAEFDPYQLNGGLVAAVAGRDYVLLATDTRLIGRTGYDILERQHVQSRLWTPHGNRHQRLFGADGSLQFPPATATTEPQQQEADRTSRPTPITTMIGSAGCQADCEMLKRTVRSEIKREMGGLLSASSVAVLLQQILYSRRTFPWYAFCVVAGFDIDSKQRQQPSVFVYDAIGSYESVAVAAQGTGRELLQPILDRSFSSSAASGERSAWIATARPQVVQQSIEEAVSLVLQAYRAVAERNAAVGDHVVLCCLQKKEDGSISCWTQSSPLKKH